MAPEGSSGCELTQAVTDHVFGDVDRHVPPAVVDSNRVPNHLREYDAGAAPGAEYLLLASLVHGFHALEKLGLDKRAFLE